MVEVRIAGRVVTPAGVVDGEVVLDGGRIVAVRPLAGPVPDRWVAPGFVELQVNGGYGIDVTTEPERIPALAARLPEQGVTAFLPTVVSCPPAVRDHAIATFAELGDVEGAVPLGLHLEGPMLAPVRRGAHPADVLVAPTPALVAAWSRDAGVALVTLAPELPGAPDVIAALVGRGVVVSVGHTDASVADVVAARAAGARYVTHLYNAMRPFGHRDPGPIGAVLADDALVAGLICDGLHVDPTAVRLAWRALGPARTSLVTDAVAPLGVEAHPDGVRTASGVLAGSVLRLDEALRNLVAWTGCAVPDALATVTSTPAAVLGLPDRGRLVPGARADVTVLDADLRVTATYVSGRRSC